ncbi:hypothetical protein GN958_ATG23271 [Phytophthora infestans]|uniref:RxLR effector PexRD54 WY domain-containing protein n=1 Tax=Phytophthora infestans TaxID=4787 RepID=A0A8S9TJA7_PHYIN|nr:hypothetical protein GN958_ATG23271 [Phytophthora infestans]
MSTARTQPSVTKILATVIILACINVVSTASTSKLVRIGSFAANSDLNEVSHRRFLRTSVAEERKLALSFPWLGQAVSGTQSWAATLLQTLQQKWSQMRMKSPNDMFKKLKLDNTGDQLFSSPSFSKWLSYVRTNSKTNPDMAIFSTLAYHYSDEALVKLLDAAKKVDSTKVLATKLEGLQFTNWVHARESPEYVFKVLALDRMGSNTFTSPQFSKWLSYMNKAETSDPEMAIYRVLGTYHSDDVLVKMFAAAKQAESTRALASSLEKIQFENWARGGESPSHVFKALALDQMDTQIFASPQFSKWTSFVSKANTKNPDVAMYTTLGTFYSDDILAKMFAAGKQVDSTKGLATRLEGIQLANWENAGKSAESAFKTLKLDTLPGSQLFESQFINTWASFVTRTHKDPDAIMVALLKDRYGDETLAKMIAAATKTERTEKLAVDLRSAQFKTWFSQGKTPENVNTLFKVAANSDDLTKKISREYDIFFGKSKVAFNRPANRPARNGIYIAG